MGPQQAGLPRNDKLQNMIPEDRKTGEVITKITAYLIVTFILMPCRGRAWSKLKMTNSSGHTLY